MRRRAWEMGDGVVGVLGDLAVAYWLRKLIWMQMEGRHIASRDHREPRRDKELCYQILRPDQIKTKSHFKQYSFYCFSFILQLLLVVENHHAEGHFSAGLWLHSATIG